MSDNAPADEETTPDMDDESPETLPYPVEGDIDSATPMPRRLDPRANPSQTSSSPKVPGYQLTEVLGQGGMGTVWRAIQLGTKREVALKLMSGAMIGSPKARMRFEREVELSATLEHPNIARVYEAGENDGVIYYAMQVIDGAPLDEYVQAQGLPSEKILELMRSVCLAVQHAHSRGVIHRDLKPSNVLVSSDGEPHVLDFGLAKTVVDNESGQSHPTITREGDLAGTLAYMAPEQAAGRVREIDARSDVYALGVIFYRLLALRHPYDLKGRNLHESIRVVIEKEPSPLSAIDRTFRGDVETIVAKAMSKDSSRRYPTAQAMADDISRYLNNEPIEARPASAFYQVQKFARRNRALVGGAATIFLALLLGVAGISLGLARALDAEEKAKQNEANARRSADAERAARIQLEANEKRLIAAHDVAQSERATTEAINRFTVEMFQQADPRQTGLDAQRDITVAETLDRTVQRLDGAFKDQPAIEAALRQVIGKTYLNLGYYRKSNEQLQRSHALRKQLMQRDEQTPAGRTIDPEAIVLTYIDLAFTAFRLGNYDRSRALLEEALPYSIQQLGRNHLTTLYVQSELARVLPELGRSGEANELYDATLAALREHHGGQDRTVNLMANLGMLRLRQGRLAEAEPLMREAFESYVAKLGWKSPITLEVGNNLSVILNNMKRVDEAAELAMKVFAYKKKALGENHPSTLITGCHLAWQRAMLGERDPAITQLLDLLARSRKHAGPTSLPSRFALDYLTELMPRAGRSPELVSLVNEIMSTEPQWKDDAPLSVAALKNHLGQALIVCARPDLAEPVFTGALDGLAVAKSARSSLIRLELLESLIAALRMLRRTSDLVTVNREQLDLLLETYGPSHGKTVFSRTSLGMSLCKSPDPALANEAAGHLREIVAFHRETLGPTHATTLSTWIGLVNALASANKLEEANAEIDAVVLRADAADAVPHQFIRVVPMLRALARTGSPVYITPKPLQPATEAALIQLRKSIDALVADGQLDEAGERLQAYSRACVAQLGAGHPTTLRAAISVAENLRRRGHRDQARLLLVWVADRGRINQAPDDIRSEVQRQLNVESSHLLEEAKQVTMADLPLYFGSY